MIEHTLDERTKRELCSLYVPIEGLIMIRAVVEEAAAITSITLFLGMVAIWAQVLATL
jgi:hypothetical protein